MGERNGNGDLPPKFNDQDDSSEVNTSEVPVPAIETDVAGDSSDADTNAKEKARKAVGTAVSLFEFVRRGDEQAALSAAEAIAADPHDAYAVFRSEEANGFSEEVQVVLALGIAQDENLSHLVLVAPDSSTLFESVQLTLAAGVAKSVERSYMVLTDAETGPNLPQSVREVLVDGVSKDERHAMYVLKDASCISLSEKEKMILASVVAGNAQLSLDTLTEILVSFPEKKQTVWKAFPYEIKVMLIESAIDAPEAFPYIITMLDEVLLESMLTTHIDVIRKLITRAKRKKEWHESLTKKLKQIAGDGELRIRLESAYGAGRLSIAEEDQAGSLSIDSNVGGLSTVESAPQAAVSEVAADDSSTIKKLLQRLQFWKRTK